LEKKPMKQYLALDVGGTKTHIALFTLSAAAELKIHKEKKYKTQDAQGLAEMLMDFHPDMSDIEAISIAIAGPVIDDEVQLTNVSWKVEKKQLVEATGVSHIYLLNDLEASAYGIPYMPESDLHHIFESEKVIPGNAAVIAPGTGLGEAGLYWDGKHFHPFATEGGHCDFSPRDKTDVSLLIFLQHKYGHVSWERLVSGMGIVNIFDFLRISVDYDLDPELEATMLQGDIAANVSKAAMDGEQVAVDTMRLFIRFLAIESANMALKFKSTGGLYIGGGIVPKVWNPTYQEMFLEHFFDVGRMEALLRCMNVTIILNPISVLFGAAHYISPGKLPKA